MQKETRNHELAIIGASYLQLPLIEKAKEMGYTTHVFAWAAGDVGEAAADRFYPISIVEKENILEVCRRIGICGVTSIASDLAAVTVNYVAAALGLPGNPPEVTARTTNKYLMRQAFAAGEDPSPRSVLVDDATDLADLDLAYPIIVKPTDRSGSRGVCKLEGPAGLKKAVAVALGESFEKRAVVEEFAEGQEYSAEGICWHGQYRQLAVTRKYTTGAPHFIETGHREPAPLPPQTVARVEAVLAHAVATLGVQNSATHAEFKIDGAGRIQLIEIGARMGGDCIGSHLVPLSTGYDYLRMVIEVACGLPPTFAKAGAPRAVESVFLLTPGDVAELERLRRETPQKILAVVDYHPEKLGHTTDSSNRAGCYIRLADETC